MFAEFFNECRKAEILKRKEETSKSDDVLDLMIALRDQVLKSTGSVGLYFSGTAADDSPPTNSLDATLAERGARYGKLIDHARITQALKRTIALELEVAGKVLAEDQQEALDMICHKIGRIINGDANYADSWVDIAGYAKLVSNRLEGH